MENFFVFARVCHTDQPGLLDLPYSEQILSTWNHKWVIILVRHSYIISWALCIAMHENEEAFFFFPSRCHLFPPSHRTLNANEITKWNFPKSEKLLSCEESSLPAVESSEAGEKYLILYDFRPAIPAAYSLAQCFVECGEGFAYIFWRCTCSRIFA